MAARRHWENMIKLLLGDNSPCKRCAVRAMCQKSFVNRRKGGGCPELKEALQEALRERHDENKN